MTSVLLRKRFRPLASTNSNRAVAQNKFSGASRASTSGRTSVKFLIFIFGFILIFLNGQLAFAAKGTPLADASCAARSANSKYRVANGASVAVNELNYCTIINNSAGKDLLVPTCTLTEYLSFLDAAILRPKRR